MDTSPSTKDTFPRRTVLKAGAATAGLFALGVASGAAPAAASDALAKGDVTAKTPAKQSGWRWCNRCQCLFYEEKYTTGWCPRGGGHNYYGSGNYTPSYGSGAPGQSGWCWCSKCQNMWYTKGNGSGRCSAGGGHSKQGSGDYHMAYGNPHGGEQTGWRWCRKCYCFCYSGKSDGWCPQGGHHNYQGSGNYYLDYVH